MQRLWAPWRMEYVGGGQGPEGCLFCEAYAPGDDADRLVLWRGPLALVMLNRYPYANGHLMVAPARHTADPADLSPAEGGELMRLVGACTRRLAAAMAPHGFNVGMNLGRVAGAGVEHHLHVHVVPRWSGDTNFMPVLADVRVVPQHLADTRAALAPRFADLAAPAAGGPEAAGKR